MKEGGAGGEMGWECFPGWERFLVFVSLGCLLHHWGWWCEKFAVQSMEALPQICKCCFGKDEREKDWMWATGCSCLCWVHPRVLMAFCIGLLRSLMWVLTPVPGYIQGYVGMCQKKKKKPKIISPNCRLNQKSFGLGFGHSRIRASAVHLWYVSRAELLPPGLSRVNPGWHLQAGLPGLSFPSQVFSV